MRSTNFEKSIWPVLVFGWITTDEI